MKSEYSRRPVAVIGAGPVGLAAIAHLLERGFAPQVFESGDSVAAHLEAYRHVQLFSPWRFDIDAAARRMLERTPWQAPPDTALPTAGEVIDNYLAPLSRLPAIAAALHLRHHVVDISKAGFDKAKSAGREQAPFVLRVATPKGLREFTAWAVIDASGTWGTPNPLGANGLPAQGEHEHAGRIAYGMPDVLGALRGRYAGKHVLVVGAGHSAAGTLLSLAKLAENAPGTRISWTIRSRNFTRIFGGGENDGLAARGALGKRLQTLAESGTLTVEADFRAQAIEADGDGLAVLGFAPDGSARRIAGVEEIIVSAGARPNLHLASELRVKLDPWIESTEALAPLIDPNLHSCGTVRPHGHRELSHPEERFYAVGAKSYGRAPNFLLATGYEQVRSVAAALAGDFAAADAVHLELPETGVCSTQFDEAASGCCGGPPVARADACCAKDEVAKDAGAAGCGCGASPTESSVAIAAPARAKNCCA